MDTSTVWKQRLSNWGCGVLAAGMGLTFGAAVLAVYRVLEALTPLHWAGPRWLTFGLAFLSIDGLYYLQHRAEHRVRWLWAFHAVHHQSRLCDTSVSFRTSMFAPVLVLLPHLVLALAGCPFEVYFPAYVLHVGLVFLLHARTPRWLDRSGWVFNSPYLHRAHHSNHPKLRGKNLGGVFIVWDRLLGTFEPDCDGAREYGIGKRETPLHPLAANLGPLRAL